MKYQYVSSESIVLLPTTLMSLVHIMIYTTYPRLTKTVKITTYISIQLMPESYILYLYVVTLLYMDNSRRIGICIYLLYIDDSYANSLVIYNFEFLFQYDFKWDVLDLLLSCFELVGQIIEQWGFYGIDELCKRLSTLSSYMIHYTLISGFLYLRLKLYKVLTHLYEYTTYKHLVALIHTKHMIVLDEFRGCLELFLNLVVRNRLCVFELERLGNASIQISCFKQCDLVLYSKWDVLAAT